MNLVPATGVRLGVQAPQPVVSAIGASGVLSSVAGGALFDLKVSC